MSRPTSDDWTALKATFLNSTVSFIEGAEPVQDAQKSHRHENEGEAVAIPQSKKAVALCR